VVGCKLHVNKTAPKKKKKKDNSSFIPLINTFYHPKQKRANEKAVTSRAKLVDCLEELDEEDPPEPDTNKVNEPHKSRWVGPDPAHVDRDVSVAVCRKQRRCLADTCLHVPAHIKTFRAH
jgi:hypothetical protein